MKFTLIVLLVLPSVFSVKSMADDSQTQAESQIAGVFDQLTEAWRTGNGNAWADAFVDDADFTVWFGLAIKGKEQIARGHQLIFDNFYADTVFKFDIRQVRFIKPDVAVVHLSGSVVRNGENLPAEPDAVPMAVLEQIGDDWKIVAFQNTPFVVNEFRANGDLKRFKKFAAEHAQNP